MYQVCVDNEMYISQTQTQSIAIRPASEERASLGAQPITDLVSSRLEYAGGALLGWPTLIYLRSGAKINKNRKINFDPILFMFHFLSGGVSCVV